MISCGSRAGADRRGDDNPDGPGTRLLFSRRACEPDDPVIPFVTPGRAQIILRLKGYAETGKADPCFDACAGQTSG